MGRTGRKPSATVPNCPNAPCPGKLHSKGRNRGRRCSVCGYSEQLKRGRPAEGQDGKPMSRREKYLREKRLRKKMGKTRIISYALFNPDLVPEGCYGVIHQEALVGTTTGCSRKSVEAANPGFAAIPLGSLTTKERRWISESLV